MKNRYPLAALALLTILASVPRAEAQGAPSAAAAAARRQKLAAQQAAIIAAAKKNAAATPTATPTTVATINRPIPTATPTTVATTPTVAPTVTAAPKPTVTAAPTTTASAAPKPSASAATSAAPVASAVHPDTTAIALDIDALRKSRPERRHAEFVDLQSRWGGLLADPRSADELKLHAQRFAYLQRIRALGAKDPTFVKSVDALITKEETRDSDALNALRSGALPTAAPAVAAPAAAPAAAAPTAGAVK